MKQKQNVRVLVVDDSPCFREAARQLLKLRGYVVVGEVDCGAAALEAATRLLPDALLLDVQLPDADGFEVAAELTRAVPGLAVLLVSAQDHQERTSQQGPARGFVTKSQLAVTDLSRFWPTATLPADA